MLQAVKLAMRPAIKTDAYDLEILDLIEAAKADLKIAGIQNVAETDPLIRQAIKTYCRLHFGDPEEPEKLERAYNTQKAQLQNATGYRNWGDLDGA